MVAAGELATLGRAKSGRLSTEDAINIWIARWLRIRRKDIRARFACDPRRLYDIWEEVSHSGSRDRAEALFRERYPMLAGATDFSRHRRFPKAGAGEAQLGLFD